MNELIKIVEKYPDKPWIWEWLSQNEFSKHSMVIKRIKRQDHAARTIQNGLHNWLYKAKCKDGTVGIVPRLNWNYLCNEKIVNQ